MTQQTQDLGAYRTLARRAAVLEPEQEVALITAAQHGERAAIDALVESHLRLVLQIAGRFARQGMGTQDLVSEGVLGLLVAIERFEITHRVRFSSYAAHWVRAYIRRYALANRRIVGAPSTRGARVAQGGARKVERRLTQELGRAPERFEVAAALDISVADLELAEAARRGRDTALGVEAPAGIHELPDGAEGPECLVADAEQAERERQALAHALAKLNARERHVALAHLSEEGACFARMGSELGISRQRVSQIWAGAREKLRSSLAQVA